MLGIIMLSCWERRRNFYCIGSLKSFPKAYTLNVFVCQDFSGKGIIKAERDQCPPEFGDIAKSTRLQPPIFCTFCVVGFVIVPGAAISAQVLNNSRLISMADLLVSGKRFVRQNKFPKDLRHQCAQAISTRRRLPEMTCPHAVSRRVM